MIARWILTERAKLIVGKSREDHQCEEKSPLPVTLWRCAQELAGDIPARRMANEITNQQRKKLGIAERPATDDPWPNVTDQTRAAARGKYS